MKKVIIIMSMILLPIVSTQSAQANQELANKIVILEQQFKAQVLKACTVKGVPVLQSQPAAAKGNKVGGKVFRPDSTGGLMTKEFVNNPANAEYIKWWQSLSSIGNFADPATGNKGNAYSPCVGLMYGTLDLDNYSKNTIAKQEERYRFQISKLNPVPSFKCPENITGFECYWITYAKTNK